MSPLLAALLTVLVVVVLGAAVIGATLALGAAFGAAFAWAYVPVAAARYERRQRASLAALELPPSVQAPYRNREPDPAAAETDAYWQAARHAAQEAAGETAADAGRHAAAMAAVAAAPLPQRAQESVYDVWMQGVPTDGTPALRPLGRTPTSEEELSTWGRAGRPLGPAPSAADAVEPAQSLPATKPLPTVDAAAVLPQPAPYAVRYEFDGDGARTVVAEQWAGRAA